MGSQPHRRRRQGRSCCACRVGTQILDEDNETAAARPRPSPASASCLLKGGDGGFGNAHYKSSTNRAPRRADTGWPGEERWVWLRLKLIADVGLVGLPNAGKSTFLAATSARQAQDRRLSLHHPAAAARRGAGRRRASSCMADIPGLIEGAHEGAGLGTRFLGHVERCARAAASGRRHAGRRRRRTGAPSAASSRPMATASSTSPRSWRSTRSTPCRPTSIAKTKRAEARQASAQVRRALRRHRQGRARAAAARCSTLVKTTRAQAAAREAEDAPVS